MQLDIDTNAIILILFGITEATVLTFIIKTNSRVKHVESMIEKALKELPEDLVIAMNSEFAGGVLETGGSLVSELMSEWREKRRNPPPAPAEKAEASPSASPKKSK